MTPSIFSPDYINQQQVANLQQMAAQQNTLRVQMYKGQCTEWVANNTRNRELGLAITPVPTIPKKVIITDDGNWTEGIFEDLTAPTLPDPVSAVSAASAFSGMASKTPPMDRTDQILALLSQMNSTLTAIITKLK